MKPTKILNDYKKKYNFETTVVPCTEEETAAYTALIKEGKSCPKGITAQYHEGTQSYTFTKQEALELTPEELDLLIKYKQLDLIAEIKKHTKFFYVLAIIGIIAVAIAAIIVGVKLS